MRNGAYEFVLAPKDYPGKKYRQRYIYEHHLVMWRSKGIIINVNQVVHHKNGNKRDNRISNLEVQCAQAHRKEHGQDRRKIARISTVCGLCLKPIVIERGQLKSRLKKNKFGKIFCSTACGATHQGRTKTASSMDCGYCGKPVSKCPSILKTRLNRNKSKQVFCSRRCGSFYAFRGGGQGDSRVTVNDE